MTKGKGSAAKRKGFVMTNKQVLRMAIQNAKGDPTD
jgi:hypothetical protein